MGFLLMSVPIRTLSKCPVTKTTLVWLLFEVNCFLVFISVRAVCKRLITVSAHVGTYIEMWYHFLVYVISLQFRLLL